MISSHEEITAYLKQLEKEQNIIEEQVYDIVLFTPSGGISLSEAWGLSSLARNKIIKKINQYRKDKAGIKDGGML